LFLSGKHNDFIYKPYYRSYPYRAQINILIGFVALAWVSAPLAYYNNLWGSKAMPIVSNRVFTADGYFYNVTAVLNSHLRLNESAYRDYGMLIR
jgi:hypothetical protein